MFYRLKLLFNIRDLAFKVYEKGVEINDLKNRCDEITDELNLLKKLVKRKETKVVNYIESVYSMYSKPTLSKEDYMEKERDKLRAEGYSFCHRHANGSETWAKD